MKFKYNINVGLPEIYWMSNEVRFKEVTDKLHGFLPKLWLASVKDRDSEYTKNTWADYNSLMEPLRHELGTTEDMDIIKYLISFYFPVSKEEGWNSNSDDDLYFIKSEDGFVKIGRSNNPERRLGAIQTSNHKELKLLARFKNKGVHENETHQRFKKLNIRGEWYKLTDEIKDFIKEKSN